MGQININIRMDDAIKRDFERLCVELGLNMSVAFNLFARTALRRQGIPFPVALDTPNAETIAAINEVQELKQDPNKKVYANFDELLKEVEADV
ncbi:MAG: type II toxin-antitoxin system RelB/DinJ family antitoxin [Anaerovoracaceae bacterium]